MKKPSKKLVLGLISAVVALAVIAGVAGGFAYRHYPYYLAKKEAFDVRLTESAAGELTAMSFNIRLWTPTEQGKRNWYYRADLAAKSIAENAPDVIGMQEVKARQYDYFCETLKGYDSVLLYRDDSPDPESCPVFYRSDKYELLDQGHFWISETPEVMSIDWDSGCYRVCSYVVLLEKSTLKEFAVFNTHLDHVSETARVNGMQVLLKKIAELGDTPVILMGDMNADESSESYAAATQVLLNAKYQAADTMEAPTYHNWGKKGVVIDHIFTSQQGLTAQKYWVVTDTYDGHFISDHNPVCVKFSLN